MSKEALEKLALQMAGSVKSYVARQLAPLNTRLSTVESLEARVRALELAMKKEPE